MSTDFFSIFDLANENLYSRNIDANEALDRLKMAPEKPNFEEANQKKNNPSENPTQISQKRKVQVSDAPETQVPTQISTQVSEVQTQVPKQRVKLTDAEKEAIRQQNIAESLNKAMEMPFWELAKQALKATEGKTGTTVFWQGKEDIIKVFRSEEKTSVEFDGYTSNDGEYGYEISIIVHDNKLVKVEYSFLGEIDAYVYVGRNHSDCSHYNCCKTGRCVECQNCDDDGVDALEETNAYAKRMMEEMKETKQ